MTGRGLAGRSAHHANARTKILIPALSGPLIFAAASLTEGRHLEDLVTERGAGSDNEPAVERLEAHPASQAGARPRKARRPADRKARLRAVSQAPGRHASRVYPTCALNTPISGKPEIGCAPSPPLWEGRKRKRLDAAP
jgi:hypothetical protein